MGASSERWTLGRSYIEVRSNEDGALDEVVGREVNYQLKQMDDGLWWMAVEFPDTPDRLVVVLFRRGKAVEARDGCEIRGIEHTREPLTPTRSGEE